MQASDKSLSAQGFLNNWLPGQGELTAIRDLSNQAIEASKEMAKDMDNLFEVINHMNEVISGIESISRQTNLLALNA